MLDSFFQRLTKGQSDDDEELPAFEKSQVVRKHVIFEGDVQGVGFRFQISQKADPLDLVGWVKNLPNGTVETEIQGEEKKVDYLIESMKNHRYIPVDKIHVDQMEIKDHETDYKVHY